MTRKEAQAAGLTRYDSMKPCPRGHMVQRMVSTRGCVACIAIKLTPEKRREMERKRKQANPEKYARLMAEWRANNPERAKANARRLRDANPEKYRAATKKWAEANPERVRASRRRRNGVTNPSGEMKRDSCEICGTVCQLHYDHDHKTGGFRGWICGHCNRALGCFRDDPSILASAIRYLKKHAKLSSCVADYAERLIEQRNAA